MPSILVERAGALANVFSQIVGILADFCLAALSRLALNVPGNVFRAHRGSHRIASRDLPGVLVLIVISFDSNCREDWSEPFCAPSGVASPVSFIACSALFAP